MARTYYIYNDEGSDDQLVKDLQLLLVSATFDAKVSLLKAIDVSDIHYSEGDVFIMPGGADLPYLRLLKGAAARNIINFVKEGGRYVGFCAGAYFGCNAICWDKGLPSEISGERPLKFFSGTAFGPAFGIGTYDCNSRSGARAARIRISSTSQSGAVYYNGGCYFDGSSVNDATEIIATYEELEGRPAALISCSVGRGKAILSGVHPEFNIEHLNGANAHENMLFRTLCSERYFSTILLNKALGVD